MHPDKDRTAGLDASYRAFTIGDSRSTTEEGRVAYRCRQVVVLCVMVAFAASVLVASAAHAGSGGSSIASAPQLPIGTKVVGGDNRGDYGEFWRIPLKAGDRLTIDFGSINGCYTYLYVYAPNVTDNSLRNADSVVSDSTSAKGELTWTANGSGSWIIRVGSCGYEMTARVKRGAFASAAGGDSIATAPPLRVGARIVSGANRGDYGEFWRIRLRARDRLTLNFGTINGCYTYVYLYNPRVTDYTIRNANSVVSDSTSSKGQLRWTATRSGRWIVRVSSCGYQLTASVRHRRT
jgi:hypothetical protein